MSIIRNDESKFKKFAGDELLKILEEHFSTRSSSSERIAVARAIMIESGVMEGLREDVPSGDVNPEVAAGNEEDDRGIAVAASVTGPGRLVETNGEYDLLTGTVFWSMYSPAAALGPVVLRAVFDPQG